MKNKAFTLVELMIVIAIIGILAATLFPSITSYLGRGRDSQRLADIRKIGLSLDLYGQDLGQPFPMAMQYGRGASAPGFWDTWWDLSSYSGTTVGFMNPLMTNGYMKKVPRDPNNLDLPNILRTGNNRVTEYIYYSVPTGYANTCLGKNNNIYMLAIGRLEGGKNTTITGCSCLFDGDNTGHGGMGTNQWGSGFFDSQFDYVMCKIY